AEHTLLDAVDDLDDAAAVADGVALVAGFLDAQQGAVTDAGDLVRSRTPRHRDVDLRRVAVRLLVPFRRHGDELAVGIAAGDVGEHDGGEGAGAVQLLAAPLDAAIVGELAQHALERDAVGVFHVEGASNLARPDLALLGGDKGEEILLGGEGWFANGFNQ